MKCIFCIGLALNIREEDIGKERERERERQRDRERERDRDRDRDRDYRDRQRQTDSLITDRLCQRQSE